MARRARGRPLLTRAPGTSLPDPGFAGDAGEPDAALTSALAAFAQDAAAAARVLQALAAARVLVPVVAVAVREEVSAGGARPGTGEIGTDMALVTLEGTDGRRALPVFSGLRSLAAWDPSARPVPVEAARAALAGAAEGAAVLVLDVAGPVPFVVGGPAVRRMAQGDPLVPLWEDPTVREALRGVLAREPAVRAAWLGPVRGADARLALHVPDAGAGPALRALAERVGAGLTQDETVRAAVLLGLEVALVDAEPPGARSLGLSRRG